MGHTTSISDYELERGDGPPPCEGVDIEGQAENVVEVEEVDVEALTVAELRAQLDELGVEYASNDHKADLQEKLYAALG